MTIETINTEGVFYSTSYTTKSGWKATFQLPDDEAAKALDAIGSGKRYMLVLAPIADDETPDKDAMQKVKKSPAQMAGILCNDVRFWNFLHNEHPIVCQEVLPTPHTMSADGAAIVLRSILSIESRSEIKEGTDKLRHFNTLKNDFDVFTGRIAGPR